MIMTISGGSRALKSPQKQGGGGGGGGFERFERAPFEDR